MSLIDVLTKTLDLKPKVTFKEFVTSKEFCGASLYDYWYNCEKEFPASLNELIIDGSIGSGKTTFANYYVAYRIYCLLSSGSPQQLLGISTDSEIYVFYFSVSLSVAKKAGYLQLYNIFLNCSWFKNNCPINTDLKSSIYFPTRHFHIDYASTEYHAIGLNVWGFILDEANFRSGVGLGVSAEYAEVTQMYTQLYDRVTSRFARPDGTFDGLAVLISSASYQSSFLEKRKSLVKDLPNSKCVTAITYEVRPERYSKERFTVFIGNGAKEACIIDSQEQMDSLVKEFQDYSHSLFRKVPVSLKETFKQNIILALQNHCGVPTMIEGAFMSNALPLQKSYTEVKPIFSNCNLIASTDDDTQLIEYLIPSNIEYPERPHSLYLDLSVQHDVGSLVCYRYDGKVDNEDIHTRVFSLRILPPPYPAQTKIQKIKQLIVDLSQYLTIVAFGSDQFQCLTSDTLVHTPCGYKKISEVTVDDKVIFQSKPVQVTGVMEFDAYVRRLEFVNGAKIYATPEHRFKVNTVSKHHHKAKVDTINLIETRFIKGYELSESLYPYVYGSPAKDYLLGCYFIAGVWNESTVSAPLKVIPRPCSEYARVSLGKKVEVSSYLYKLGVKSSREILQLLLQCKINMDDFILGITDAAVTKVTWSEELNTVLQLSLANCMGDWILDYNNGVLQRRPYDPSYRTVVRESVVNDKMHVYDISVDSNDHLYELAVGVTHNSTQIRQDINAELGLDNIRLSLDSSDVPYMHWLAALNDGRIKQSEDKYLEKECLEAVHDYAKHRVIKNKKSSDDVLQGNVGAFYLSDTYGKSQGLSVDGLHEPTNLVGGHSITHVLKVLGYSQC